MIALPTGGVHYTFEGGPADGSQPSIHDVKDNPVLALFWSNTRGGEVGQRRELPELVRHEYEITASEDCGDDGVKVTCRYVGVA